MGRVMTVEVYNWRVQSTSNASFRKVNGNGRGEVSCDGREAWNFGDCGLLMSVSSINVAVYIVRVGQSQHEASRMGVVMTAGKGHSQRAFGPDTKVWTSRVSLRLSVASSESTGESLHSKTGKIRADTFYVTKIGTLSNQDQCPQNAVEAVAAKPSLHRQQERERERKTAAITQSIPAGGRMTMLMVTTVSGKDDERGAGWEKRQGRQEGILGGHYVMDLHHRFQPTQPSFFFSLPNCACKKRSQIGKIRRFAASVQDLSQSAAGKRVDVLKREGGGRGARPGVLVLMPMSSGLSPSSPTYLEHRKVNRSANR